jgi:hypothetical protein
LDEMRVSRGAARWTSNFKPPIVPWEPAPKGALPIFKQDPNNIRYIVTSLELESEVVAQRYRMAASRDGLAPVVASVSND